MPRNVVGQNLENPNQVADRSSLSELLAPSGQFALLPGEDPEAFRVRERAFLADLAARTTPEGWFAGRLVRETWCLDRCDRLEVQNAAMTGLQDGTAPAPTNPAQEAQLRAMLASNPTATNSHLEATPEGVIWLARQWDQLHTNALRERIWSGPEIFLFFNLLGYKADWATCRGSAELRAILGDLLMTACDQERQTQGEYGWPGYIGIVFPDPSLLPEFQKYCEDMDSQITQSRAQAWQNLRQRIKPHIDHLQKQYEKLRNQPPPVDAGTGPIANPLADRDAASLLIRYQGLHLRELNQAMRGFYHFRDQIRKEESHEWKRLEKMDKLDIAASKRTKIAPDAASPLVPNNAAEAKTVAPVPVSTPVSPPCEGRTGRDASARRKQTPARSPLPKEGLRRRSVSPPPATSKPPTERRKPHRGDKLRREIAEIVGSFEKWSERSRGDREKWPTNGPTNPEA